MTQIREVLAKNHLYTQGLVFDKNFYKDNISDEVLNQDVKTLNISENYIISCVVEIAKKVALIALVVLPSLAILGPYMFGSVFLTGVASGVISEAISSEDSLLRRLDFQAEINSCLDQAKAYIQPAIEALSNLAVSFGVYGVMTFATGILSNICVYAGAFMSGKILAEEAIAIGLDLVERDAKIRHEAILAAR